MKLPAESARVGYLGPRFSFTYFAARGLYPDLQLEPYETVGSVFRALERSAVDYAVLSIENSIAGPVMETMHLLVEQPLIPDIKIVDEYYLPVEHFVLARTADLVFDDVDAILSHRSVRDQCFNWIEKNLPHAQFEPMPSTAEAAEQLPAWCKEKGQEAVAIGPEALANEYGLAVVDRHIQDHKNNTTRFVALSKRPPTAPMGKKKATIATILVDRPSALLRLLQSLASREINLDTIRMAPVRTAALFNFRDWFVLDLTTSLGAEDIRRQLADVYVELTQQVVLVMKNLGTYGARNALSPRQAADRIFEVDGPSSEQIAVVAGPRPGGLQLLSRMESDHLELKQTLRWNVRDKKVDSTMELEVARAIAAFMNTDGGVVAIGVADDGTVVGIGEDLKSVQRHNADGLAQAVAQLVVTYLGVENGPSITVEFEPATPEPSQPQVCFIRVKRSYSPVYLRTGSKSEFYIRVTNTTRRLETEEAMTYIARRFTATTWMRES